MANTKYTDIYDPEVIEKLIGAEWLNEAVFVQSGIIRRDARPMQGTLTTIINQKTFQGRSGQALKANDAISTANKSQEGANNPRLFRYDGLQEPDVIDKITAINIDQENANMADAIRMASSQYVDDSAIAGLKGISASLTANQYDAGASAAKTFSLANIVLAKAKALDKINQLNGGGIVMNSTIYNLAVGLGLVAATSNTFGNSAQDGMVADGQLPNTIVGLTPIVTDKNAGLGSNIHNTYLVGANTFVVRGDSSPSISIGRLDGKLVTETLFSVDYGIGQDKMNWGVSGKEDVNDTELATSSNWTLSSNANSNDVAIYRLQTDES